uniref:HEAT repeat-containing protein 1 n=1 Tax=Sphaeramia orbicularis TaxID=375764 RepID=A0A673BD23_9TELE
MTSLSHQLKRLALPQTDASLLICHDVASLLFDPKDAATMDRSTFYALGCTGLEELLGLDPVFADFQQTLFSPSSQTLERSVQSKEVNRQLDDSISLFLSRLCPYFLLKPAHKCMEWLIHRFHIHLYNVDSLLSCVFPYHDTKVFVRVLQLLRIKDSAHRWNWLQCLQKPGVPLSRAALVVHCTTDLGFMDFICSMVPTSIQAFSAHPGGCSQLRVVFSFYASTIVSALDAVEKVSESIISKLLPYVHKGLKSPLADYKAASYMIVCQLAVSVVLEAGLVDALAFQVVKSVVKEPVLDKEGLGCLMVLLQNQKDGAAGPRVFSRLCSMASLVPTLQLMSSRHDITPLMRHLVPHLVTGVFSGSGTNVDTPPDAATATASPTSVWRQTCVLVFEGNLEKIKICLCFFFRYCSALDDVLAGHVTDVDNDEQKRLFHEFLSLSMSSGKYKVKDDVHLPEPLMLFRFLCLLWGYGGNHGDQLDVKVGAVLQTQALYMGRALLASQNAATLRLLADAHSPVVPSLLVCLCSPVREVRRAGLGVLQSLSAADASPYQPITERLLRNSEEITADPSYLNTVRLDLILSSKSQTQQKKLQTSMQQLLEVVRSPNCPSYTAGSLLRAMSHVNGPDVLSALLPVLDRLQDQAGPDVPALLADEARLVQLLLGKFTQESAPLLATDRKCLELFVCALKSSAPSHPSIPSSQIIALEQISKSFFSSVGDESVQQKLLAVMFDLLVDNRSPQVANGVSSAFKGISVDAQLVANELSPPDKPAVGGTVQQSRRSRMTSRKKADGGVAEPEGGAVSWGRVCLILELLQHKKKLKRVQTLVPVLFSLLSRCLESGPADQTSVEYTKQLLLSCLLNVCTKLGPDGPAPDPGVLDEDKFSVELVVQCIRMSEVPQTHHQALLLLGSVAAIFPDKVLLNIMPIFTFMGANIMRLDDAYSFRVIDKTVQMVIPALIQLSDGQTSPHMVAMATRIMHVFADALPHVPEHRRLPILTQLVTTLGPAHFLWALMLLLFKLHATAAHAGDKDAALQKDLDFWICVCGQFEVNEQLTSVVRILGFLLRLPDDKDDGETQQTVVSEKGEDLIFNVDAHSSKELRHFKFICVSFMAQLLRSNSFIEKRTVFGGPCPSERTLCFRLLEEILRYIHSVARCVEENADKPTAKFWRVLLNKAYEVLDQMNALLPTDTFITVMKGLMGNELPSVRRKAMELLNNKLQHRTRWEEPQVAVFLALIDDLLSVVGKPRSQLTRDGVAEHAVNRQTALYSLKLLCRGFGSAHQEAFAPVLVRAVEIVTATEEDKNVTGSGLLCIAEVVSTLKARAIPQLPRLMPAVLSALRDRKELLTNEIYLLSAVTALQRITETLPHFISPYLQDVTSQVSAAANARRWGGTGLSARLSALRNTLSTKLPPRVLLPTVSRTYSSLVLDRKTQLGALMSILKEHISHMDKDQLSVHQSELTAFFLTALDFRSEHCKDDLDEAERVEGAVIDCLVAMVMKLSEVTFRPLFFKLFDWSKSEVGGADRLLTFYRLTDAVADRLKGLFVLFAGNLVKPFADLLRRSERLFESDPGEHKTCLLLRSVLDAMTKVFMYDTQRFLSAERAHTLMSPLVDQVENLVGGAERYQQRVSQHLVPCVGQFAAALADHAHWKTLNYQVLLKTRHSHAEVRFSALLLLLEVASKLKENYVVLLPETIPFLAELMEDECEQVEQQVQSVVQEMENILGEPLNAYF